MVRRVYALYLCFYPYHFLIFSPRLIGFQHVRSFSGTEGKADGISSSTTTALWVHQGLADHGTDQISSVLKLKRADRGEASSLPPKTPQERRERKQEAASSVLAKPMTTVGCNIESISARCGDASTIPQVVQYRQQDHPSTYMPHETPAVSSSARYDTIEMAAPELLLSMKKR